jgi:glycosyltransferase involved in cell wall biosynthesis
VADPRAVSVVIPAFNEEDGIADVVARLAASGPWREILVVDDGSTDRTAERAAAAGARVVRHPYNKGNGAAVKTGIREAAGEVVLLMDADGQHDPAEAVSVVSPVGVHDMVIGARRSGDQTLTRAAGNRAFTALASWLTGRPIPDLTSGFRAARRDRLMDVIHLLPNGFSYPTTSCLAFLKAGFNVLFTPITARPRVGRSKIRVMRDGVRFLLIILKIVTLYSPMKVFFPVSAASLLLGIAYGIWNVTRYDKIPMGSALLIQLGVVVFLFGLISEQIASAQDRK